MQKSAVNQRLGAMSVHKGHRIFDHMGAMVCVKSGDYSMWVNRKMRPDCSGNPSTLGMEVLKRMAKRETPRSGQEWPLSVDVAPPTGMCHARFRMALWVGGLGRGSGVTMGAFLPWVRHCT